MRRLIRYIFAVALLAYACNATARIWLPDSIDGYQKTMIQKRDGDRCVVIRASHQPSDNVNISGLSPNARQALSRPAILYVHGYNDYFFQHEMGKRFVDAGYPFYAIDLHGYGRSIRKGVRPYQARDVSDYYADLDSALAIMSRDGYHTAVLVGHSTGGLITSCYLNAAYRPQVKALILNSPFLAWNFGTLMRNVLIPTVSCLGSFFPNIAINPGNNTIYAESLLRGLHGEFQYNVEWKTVTPRKITAGWIHMISSAQNQLRNRRMSIYVPILLMHSDKSDHPTHWTAAADSADIILSVSQISKEGRQLGPTITEATIVNGRHDLFLSVSPVRNAAYQTTIQWLETVFGQNIPN